MVDKTFSDGDAEEEFRLGEGSWDLLISAVHELTERLRDDVDELRTGSPVVETNLVDLMPRRFIPRYDRAFAERLAETSADLAKRLEGARGSGFAYPYESFLKSVAEEMLLSQAIQIATDESTSPHEIEELEVLQELSFEDRDFEWLYNFSHDGVTDDHEVARVAGFANLRFRDWFEPFRKSDEKD